MYKIQHNPDFVMSSERCNISSFSIFTGKISLFFLIIVLLSLFKTAPAKAQIFAPTPGNIDERSNFVCAGNPTVYFYYQGKKEAYGSASVYHAWNGKKFSGIKKVSRKDCDLIPNGGFVKMPPKGITPLAIIIPEKSNFVCAGNPTVYFYYQGKKEAYGSASVYHAWNGKKFSGIKKVSRKDCDLIPNGGFVKMPGITVTPVSQVTTNPASVNITTSSNLIEDEVKQVFDKINSANDINVYKTYLTEKSVEAVQELEISDPKSVKVKAGQLSWVSVTVDNQGMRADVIVSELVKDKSQESTMIFVKENGAWKFDLLGSIENAYKNTNK